MRPRKKIWIPVVTGLIHRDGKVLIGQRPKGSLQGQWEFPGGKIEQYESPEAALKRELMEELGIDAEIGPLRLATTHTYGERSVVILFFDIFFWKGEPKNIQHTELKWVLPDEVRHFEIPEANRKMLNEILGVLKTAKRDP